ncbi:MAG: UDP-2,4-diacetamido-2,4,6-trideoxy-beta-L-altropyranose hydrolase [Cyanobacteria bacterium SID2]|nr:UDP-2,4-diacetamido-2,4,6-trideoxy-beta-L-altropyranose hydrolase [Cyanobacteria bacterium SID2]
MNRKVVIRADASARMGTGHIMRCLALAQALQADRGQPVFAVAISTPAIEKRLTSEGMQVIPLKVRPGSPEDSRETAALTRRLKARWVVVDGYHFQDEYQRILKQSQLRLLWIDDLASTRHYYADFVLNQNISADERWYRNREPYTQLLLGTRYTLLRREFWLWRGRQRAVPPTARRLLVTLGGSDPDNVTLKVLRALGHLNIEALEVTVVVGGSNPHYNSLKAAASSLRFPVNWQWNASNMPELMAKADMAIAAGGSTCWELAFMGLPSILLILADNQRAMATGLAAAGCAVNLGWHEEVTETEIATTVARLSRSRSDRSRMMGVGQQLVDGKGAHTVVRHLEASSIQLRPVREDDCDILWQWANDPLVRAVSFCSEPIPRTDHVRWLATKLSDRNCIFYLVLDANSVPIGQIRYEMTGDRHATISASIAAPFRGRGYGRQAICLGCQTLFQASAVEAIDAYIKPSNLASIQVFLKSGFENRGETIVRSQPALHLVKKL